MNVIEEICACHESLLTDSKDADGFIQQQLVLEQILPLLLDAKLTDSEDVTDAYFISEAQGIKINAYAKNESGERLQLFMIDESTIDESKPVSNLLISSRTDYDNQLRRAARFFTEALKGNLSNQLQESDPCKVLVNHLRSPDGIAAIDVVEIFLISLTATVSFKGKEPQPRNMYYDDERISFSIKSGKDSRKKEFLIVRHVIDLNFIWNVIVSKGRRETLIVDFKKSFGQGIEVIQASDQKHFGSYLCVLSGEIIADLYKKYSTRLLEKNVRSFLQFKGVNKGIKDTIRDEPEKFIAYNNGLTITAAKETVYHKSKIMYIASLEDLQIVNGGQTTASIYFARKEGLAVDKVKVMAKINIIKETDSKSDDLIAKISKYSNTQSRVSNVDLRSRNSQLVKLKTLSESIASPKGHKWFFERAKGEFNTDMRKAGSNSSRLKNEFPKNRRFTKEELAKCFSAWGETPYLVKKGGEKIFRYFIEKISPEEDGAMSVEIDRTFYEELIARVILFRELETLYGQGKDAIGQIRSAAVPYTISVLFWQTDGSNQNRRFDLQKIWKAEGLDPDLARFCSELLKLMNSLIKKYAKSDDLGEFSKKPELWVSIKQSPEISNFIANGENSAILAKYSILKSPAE